MTIKQRIKKCLQSFNCDEDNLEKIVAIAYYIGKEKATKEVSDAYKTLLEEQRKRAENCRYHNMAAEIIGDKKYIYFPSYSGEMSAIFGEDDTIL